MLLKILFSREKNLAGIIQMPSVNVLMFYLLIMWVYILSVDLFKGVQVPEEITGHLIPESGVTMVGSLQIWGLGTTHVL